MTAPDLPAELKAARVPTHICPTCALHQEALIVEDGAIVDAWPIAARARRLTV